MKPVFADAFYFLALLNECDAAHKQAVAVSRTPSSHGITSRIVMLPTAFDSCELAHP